jgi:hypothetical protein
VYAESPQDPKMWKPIRSERFGVVNLNSHYSASKEPSSLTWLRTYVVSGTKGLM